MQGPYWLLLLLVILLHHMAPAQSSCGITSTSVSPEIIIVSSAYAEIHCNYNPTLLNFVSFYTPSGLTLTTSQSPKYDMVTHPNSVALVVRNIEESDSGTYQCNFRNVNNNNECFEPVNLELDESVDFCTPDRLTYHAYVGESITLRCCVDNYVTQMWRMGTGASNMEVSANERITFDGTHLRISPVTLQDDGVYKCTAGSTSGQYLTLTATLKVYVPLSVTIDPPQKVVNVSDRAELTCTAHAYPRPSIVWAREDTTELQLRNGVIDTTPEVLINDTTVQSTLVFFSVNNTDTGTYRCTGDNINGSLAVTASLQLFGTPSAPIIMELSIVNLTSIHISWKPPKDDGHLEILGYCVMWFRHNLLDLASERVNGSTMEYLISDLLLGTEYTVTVYAINMRGKGKGSDDRNISTHATVPGALSALQVTQLTATSVQINYTVSPESGGSPINTLLIDYQAGDDASDIVRVNISVPPQENSYKLEGLKGDTPYLVKVSVGNSVGFGPATEISFRTLCLGCPATPTYIQAESVGSTRVKLTWEDLDVGQSVTEYRVHAIENGSQSEGVLFRFKPADVNRDGDQLSVEISQLRPDTCYVFTVTVKSVGGPGTASPPSSTVCTCKEDPCPNVGEVQGSSDGSSSAQLIPILVVTITVAVIVVAVVVVVAVLSRRHSNKQKSHFDIVSSSHQNFGTSSLTSSHFSSSVAEQSSSQASSSSVGYHHQHSVASQNSSSMAESEDAPTTGSSIVSDSPFNFGPTPSQNGSPQYQNRPHQYQNGTLPSVASYSNTAEHSPTTGVQSTVSYPLFPIPENRVVAMGHVEESAPVIPYRAHLQTNDTFMTNNPAFEQPQTLPISGSALDELSDPEDVTPPPIPPYHGDENSDTQSNQPPPPQISTHTHFQARDHNRNVHNVVLPPRSQSTQSVPFLGESFSQASHSPAMPRPPTFFLSDIIPDGEEEDEVEFMENSAYESVSPQPQRREFLPRNNSALMHSETEAGLKLTTSLPRGLSASPVFPRRGASQSAASVSGSLPRFEIARNQQRGQIFETVTLKHLV